MLMSDQAICSHSRGSPSSNQAVSQMATALTAIIPCHGQSQASVMTCDQVPRVGAEAEHI